MGTQWVVFGSISFLNKTNTSLFEGFLKVVDASGAILFGEGQQKRASVVSHVTSTILVGDPFFRTRVLPSRDIADRLLYRFSS
jgi:hypothetical protein